jgi:hypothetical protein
LESVKRTSMLLQFTVIVMMSAAASYVFIHTQTQYQINGVCFYRYIAYIITVFLGYVCFAQYKKYAAFAFSLALSAVALSPIGQEAIEFFPLVVPFLAVLMGVTAFLIVPSSRGRGFFGFLVVLVLPAVLAESRIGGSFHLLATTESISYYELSAVTAIILGGYFYLRYSALTNLRIRELLSSGGSEEDVAKVNSWCNTMTGLIVVSASGITVFLMVTTSIIADALRATVAALPLYVLALAMGAGISIPTILYIFQLTHK